MSQWKIVVSGGKKTLLIETRESATPSFTGSTLDLQSPGSHLTAQKNSFLNIYTCKKPGASLERNFHILSAHFERPSDSPTGQVVLEFYNRISARRERCEATFGRTAPGMEQIEKRLAQQAKTVTSPITGKVLAVEIAKGGAVVRKQTVVVIEAMKMENKIFSPIDGTLSDLHVAKGDSVTVGQKLFKVEA